jgi:RND superfamily putative drug exporter
MEKTSLLFDRWPRLATRRPWRVLAVAVATIVAIGVISQALGGTFVDSFSIPGTESQEAVDLLTERFPQVSGDTATVAVKVDGQLTDPANRQKVEDLIAGFSALPGVLAVSNPYEEPGSISQTGNIARFTIQYGEAAFELPIEDVEALLDYRAEQSTDGFQVELGGFVPSVGEQEPPGQSELIGIVAAIIILLIAFGSVVAMGLPILTALLGLVPGFMVLGILAAFVNLASFTTAFASMIGLGVGIDYALLIVTRFRENYGNGMSKEDAIVTAAGTAGRSVLFAGSIVIIALLGLWASGIPFVGWLATGAAIIVASLVIVALFILPAVLQVLGRHLDRWKVPGISTASRGSEDRGFAYTWSGMVQRAPLLYLVIGLAIVGTLAAPVLGLRLGSADAGSSPETLTTRRAYDILAEGFGPGFNGQIIVAVSVDDSSAEDAVSALPEKLQELDNVAFVSPAIFNEERDAAIINVLPVSAPQDEATSDLVDNMRTTLPRELAGVDAQAFVGGGTAAFKDISDKISQGMPVFFTAVIGISVIILMAVFRSVVIPLKAALMIVLSVGVGFGVVVAVFQWGWLGSLFGVDTTGPVESFLPMMLFAILFGLSMDYEVFLVTRMHEEYLNRGQNAEAVRHGQKITFRVIIAAALIMSSVFLSFVLGDERVIKEFGLGLGVAILADALVIRMMVVPSIMHLLGRWTWWFPAWLDRILPKISVEATAPRRAPAEGALAD